MLTQNWSIGKKLWLLSGLLIGNLLLQGVVGFYFSRELSGFITDLSMKQIPAVRFMTLADMMHDGLRAVSYRAMLFSENPNNEDRADINNEFEEMSKNFHGYLEELGKLDLNNESSQALKAVLPLIDKYSGQAKQIVEFSLAGKRKDADAVAPDFQKTFSALEEKLGTLGDLIESGAKATQTRGYELETISQRVEGFIILLGLVVGILISLSIIRGLLKTITQVTKNLEEQARIVNSNVDVLNNSSRNLSSASTEQAAALQETASAIEETSAMVKKSAENAERAQGVSKASQEVAHKGKVAVEEMLSSMGDITVSNQNIMQQVEGSNRQISEIVKVINEIGNKTKVINDIVFQTKLLSFNASVEAARAGEHGKGFAVVAEEVGNLAQMSGNAAKEISDMLNGSIQKVEKIVAETKTQVERLVAEGKAKVNSGSLIAKQCAEVLDEMVKNVQDVNVMITEISTASKEQAQGVSEITTAMNQLDHTTHENAGIAQESAASAEQMSIQAEELLAIVAHLKKMVTGDQGDISSRLEQASMEAAPSPSLGVSEKINWKPLNKVDNAPKNSAGTFKRAKAVGADEVPSEDDFRFIDL